MSFDEDFFFNASRRVDDEQKMEKVLYDRWGNYGLGADKDKKLPQIGAVHLAAGYIISEMLGCKVDYKQGHPPVVHPANIETLNIDPQKAFQSPAYKKFVSTAEKLKQKHGNIIGDINWGGVLNVALDLRGERLFMDMFDKPDKVKKFFNDISAVIERFVSSLEKETGSSSISVNRNVRHIKNPVFLHSECSHTMISENDYEKFLLDIDAAWAKKHRPYGIHYCGPDPHRYCQQFAAIENLDFLDVGWGGDLKKLRQHLPQTFLNIRLNPVDLADRTENEISTTITQLVEDSDNPWLTGICCINMDQNVSDEKIKCIFETVDKLRDKYRLETKE
jgi:hypothetical protein